MTQTHNGKTTRKFKIQVWLTVVAALALLAVASYGVIQARAGGWAFEQAKSAPVPPPPVNCLHNTKDGDIGCPGNSK